MTDISANEIDLCLPSRPCLGCLQDLQLALLVLLGPKLPESGVGITAASGGRSLHESVLSPSRFDETNEYSVTTKLFGRRHDLAQLMVAEGSCMPQCLWLPMVDDVPESERCVIPAMKVLLATSAIGASHPPVVLDIDTT